MGHIQPGDLFGHLRVQAVLFRDLVCGPSLLRFPDHQFDLLTDTAAVDLHCGFLRGVRDLDLLTGKPVTVDMNHRHGDRLVEQIRHHEMIR